MYLPRPQRVWPVWGAKANDCHPSVDLNKEKCDEGQRTEVWSGMSDTALYVKRRLSILKYSSMTRERQKEKIETYQSNSSHSSLAWTWWPFPAQGSLSAYAESLIWIAHRLSYSVKKKELNSEIVWMWIQVHDFVGDFRSKRQEGNRSKARLSDDVGRACESGTNVQLSEDAQAVFAPFVRRSRLFPVFRLSNPQSYIIFIVFYPSIAPRIDSAIRH